MACVVRIKREFRLQSFLLSHSSYQDFTRSPWLRNPLPFVIYRIAICLYQVIVFALSTRPEPESLVYLTYQGFILLTVHTVLSAILCVYDYYKSRCSSDGSPTPAEDQPTFTEVPTENHDVVRETTTPNVLPWYYKAYWVWYNIAFTGGLFVTIAFWTLLRGVSTSSGARSVLTHAVNSVVIVIDIFVSGLPCRLLHFVYPVIYALLYVLFSAIYWAAGGRGLKNRPWIYPILDYGEKPAVAAGAGVVCILVAVPLCHAIVFALTLARDAAVKRWHKRHLPVSEGTASEPRAEVRV